jgi:hypothetical protein
MERAQIRQIAAYVKDLEEGLVEWVYEYIPMQTEWKSNINLF